MQKISEIIRYVALGILALFAIVFVLMRGLGVFLGVVLLFVRSPLPGWIRILAAIAVVAGLIYLFKHRRSRRISPNRKFVD